MNVYSLSVVTPAAVEPVTLAELKDQIRKTTNDQDAYLGTLIKSARAYVQNQTQRVLINTTYDWFLDSFPHWFALPKSPVSTLSSIKYIDTDGVTQTVATTEYVVDKNSNPCRVVLEYGKSWPTPKTIINAVTVRFVAGYGAAPSAVPDDLRIAILQIAAHWYEHSESTIEIAKLTDTPQAAKSILQYYKFHLY